MEKLKMKNKKFNYKVSNNKILENGFNMSPSVIVERFNSYQKQIFELENELRIREEKNFEWKKLTSKIRKELYKSKKYVLVTNNIKAQTAQGWMSHVWIAGFTEKGCYNPYTLSTIHNPTHYLDFNRIIK